MSNSNCPEPHTTIKGVDYSRFVRRVRARYGALSDKLEPGLINIAILNRAFDSLIQIFTKPDDALRVLRQLALERIAYLDCECSKTLDEITAMMTVLAEWSLTKAFELSFDELSRKFGVPCNVVGQQAKFWIIGMGKLGAFELNVSSDIDLIYIYDQEGETKPLICANNDDPSKHVEDNLINSSSPNTFQSISNHVFYSKLVQHIQRLLDTITEHGRVFRIDLALRPNGMSGPSVMCLDALEEYLHSHGREWERFAWLKSRVVAPTSFAGLPAELSQIVVPFVYRKYLDYQVFDSLRHLHGQIKAQSIKNALGRPERLNDIKLGKGGIREIEFITQLLQVVRGGQFPELRVRPTLEALSLLSQTRQMSVNSANSLQNAYKFLRRLEHRIQYLDDQQTHLVPTDESDLFWLSSSMGFTCTDELLSNLEHHRSVVSTEFSLLLGLTPDSPNGLNRDAIAKTPKSIPTGEFRAVLEAKEVIELELPKESALTSRVEALLRHPRVEQLKEASQKKLRTLIRQTVEWVTQDHALEVGAIRWCDWMESLLRREIYLSLLLERPTIHRNLIYLLGASRWATRYLNLHPGVIDDLADPQILLQRFNAQSFKSMLLKRMDALKESDPTDEEAVLNALRRAHQSELFQCLARDLSGKISLQEVGDDLSALAESVIQICAQVVWSRLKISHTPMPCFGIVGYGKLGGKELGYGSDLDIVFIYDDLDPNAAQIYSTFAKKIIHWLSVKTTSGDLYEIDTALRPNGNSGLLVTQFDAFENYQLQRGSNVAWLWEHQAMTRARVVLGDDSFKERFNSIRHRVLTTERDLDLLAQEIVSMRSRLQHAHAVKPDQFDLKYSPGAMIDVEFAVQYLVLGYSCKFPDLADNIGNIGLLKKAQTLGLISEELATVCIEAYKTYRYAQHRARLDERGLKSDAVAFQAHQSSVLKLWEFLFG